MKTAYTKRRYWRTGLQLLTLCLTLTPALGFPLTHHDLTVSLEPKSGLINVQDVITVDAPRASIEFSTSPKLTITADLGLRLIQLPDADGQARYRLLTPSPRKRFPIHLQGKLQAKTTSTQHSYGRGLLLNAGHISDNGVYLGPHSGWYADTSELFSFAMKVSVPDQWMAVSQGAGTQAQGVSHWIEEKPQEGITLVANRFHRYSEARAEVYLLDADDKLAKRYLDTTQRYLRRFEQHLGPYPYSKFALVENTFETGYGLPSFTLLGSRVIRFPFILHSSFPHEILHNWWGNGVYVDYAQGNWSEALTTYLSDHAIKAESGMGASYRRGLLQQFADHASDGRDFPLVAFVARHSSRSQAVGYAKGAMLFHMLRNRIGAQAFTQGLSLFFERHQFEQVGWDALIAALRDASGDALGDDVNTWLNRTGAPELALEKTAQADQVLIKQTQSDAPFPVTLPLEWQWNDGHRERQIINLTQRQQLFSAPRSGILRSVRVDPEFESFRSLHPDERPASIGALLGNEQVTLVLPRPLTHRYAALVNAWRTDSRIRLIDDTTPLPEKGAIWFLDRSNALLHAIQPTWQRPTVELGETQHDTTHDSVVLTAKHVTGQVIGMIHAQSSAAARALARKVPHYGRYGYLVFAGDNTGNKLKGEWPVSSEALTLHWPSPSNR